MPFVELNPNQTNLDTTFAQQGKWLFAADTTRQNVPLA